MARSKPIPKRAVPFKVQTRMSRAERRKLSDSVASMASGTFTAIADRVAEEWATTVINRAKANIRAGNKGTRYTLSGDLERTIIPIRGKKRVTGVSYGGNLPYAGNLNRPMGTVKELTSSSGSPFFIPNRKKLAYKGRKKRSKGYVPSRFRKWTYEYPGKAVFSEAVDYGNRQLRRITREAIAEAKTWSARGAAIGGRASKNKSAKARVRNR